MKEYEVSVTYFFWADDADHALEQFEDATSPFCAEHVNVLEPIGNGSDKT